MSLPGEIGDFRHRHMAVLWATRSGCLRMSVLLFLPSPQRTPSNRFHGVGEVWLVEFFPSVAQRALQTPPFAGAVNADRFSHSACRFGSWPRGRNEGGGAPP